MLGQKVLCIHNHCGPHYVRSGWKNVFEYCGHQFYWWNKETEPALDKFHKTKPNIFIGTTYDLDTTTIKAIKKYPEMKVILFCSAHGEYLQKVDLQKYPIVVPSTDEVQLVESIADRISFVFLHLTQEYTNGVIGRWKNHGVKPLGILNAFDCIQYKPQIKQRSIQGDILFIGGYWPYKAVNLDKYILPLCRSMYRIKIFGNQRWPVPQYLGTIKESIVPTMVASHKVCPNVSEPHSTDLGWDVIERPFKIMGMGGLCISDYCKESEIVFGSHLLMGKNPKEFIDLVCDCISSDETERIKSAQEFVLEHHTYFDRVAQMFDNMNLKEEGKKVLDAKRKYISKSFYSNFDLQPC